MATIATAVDYAVVPKRLTQAWEAVLLKRSMALTVGVLALSVAGGALINQELRRR